MEQAQPATRQPPAVAPTCAARKASTSATTWAPAAAASPCGRPACCCCGSCCARVGGSTCGLMPAGCAAVRPHAWAALGSNLRLCCHSSTFSFTHCTLLSCACGWRQQVGGRVASQAAARLAEGGCIPSVWVRCFAMLRVTDTRSSAWRRRPRRQWRRHRSWMQPWQTSAGRRQWRHLRRRPHLDEQGAVPQVAVLFNDHLVPGRLLAVQRADELDERDVAASGRRRRAVAGGGGGGWGGQLRR